MRTSLLAFVAAAVSLLALLSPGHTQEGPEWKSREFMRRKLEHSQAVLEGIALEKFANIERNAQTLSLLSQAAEWQILPSADYKRHSEEFRRTADLLAEQARKKNLDGAALAYVQLTLNCVNCHKEVRRLHFEDSRKPRPPDKDGRPPAQPLGL
jgi:hypothetical protein